MKDQRIIVRNKVKLVVGIALMALVMILNFPFPHSEPFVAGNSSAMSIPIKDMEGYKFGGLLLLTILIIGIYLLATSLEKYRARLVILAIFLYFLLPFFLINVYQNTIASGIYAIDYELDESKCEFDKMDEQRVRVVCSLPLENLSEEAATFDVRFFDKTYFGERFKLVPLINEKGPFTVTLQGRETKVVRIKTELAVSIANDYGGAAQQIHIEISKGKKMRLL